MNVDFQVGQYAKIVEDLKVQLSECKARVAALEDENEALRNQLNSQINDENSATASKNSMSQNQEELTLLKQQLNDLQVSNTFFEKYFHSSKLVISILFFRKDRKITTSYKNELMNLRLNNVLNIWMLLIVKFMNRSL